MIKRRACLKSPQLEGETNPGESKSSYPTSFVSLHVTPNEVHPFPPKNTDIWIFQDCFQKTKLNQIQEQKVLWNLMLMNVIQRLTTECQNIEYELNSKRLLFQTATKWIDMNNMWTSKILKRNLKHLIHCQYSESQTTRK